MKTGAKQTRSFTLTFIQWSTDLCVLLMPERYLQKSTVCIHFECHVHMIKMKML